MFRSSKLGWIAAAALCVAGCTPPPDPNDPRDAGENAAEVIQRNLNWASDFVNERAAVGEITEEEGKERISQLANKLLERVDTTRIAPQQAFEFGEIFRTAQRWDRAKEAYQAAIELAKQEGDEDRRVNGSLRLAECLAHDGDIDGALEGVRSTFDAKPNNKAPILMATLYEIVPPLEGKQRDGDLARLLEESIAQHEAVLIDPQTRAGVVFLAAKGFHIRRAWDKAIELYRSAGMEAEAKRAAARKAGLGTGRA